MIDGLTLGAYAAEPRRNPLDDSSERRWFQLLQGIEGASGLECFFRETLHPRGPEHLADQLPDGWHVVITALPHTVACTAAHRHYGLASAHEPGRQEAVADTRRLLGEARRIDERLGRRAVRAVQLHSAPRATDDVRSDVGALAASLGELAAEADGIPLVVEHCDALVPGRTPMKGYLPLEAEIDAVTAASRRGAPLGQSINWGRSTIEGRSESTPVAHATRLVGARRLAGLMFSGAPSAPGPLGEAWDDVHSPLRDHDGSSLLDATAVRQMIDVIDDTSFGRLLFLGAKVQDPADSDDLGERLAPLNALIQTIRSAVDARPHTRQKEDQ